MSKKLIKYGTLSDPEKDSGGFTFFGAGNTGDGWHSQQNWTNPSWTNGFTSVLTDAAGLKVHYRTGDDVTPVDSNGDRYVVDGGYQQDGVHGASGDRLDRASWNVDYSIFDRAGDFSGALVKVDINPTSATTWLTFDYDATNDVFVAIDSHGNTRVLGTGNGNGAEVGEVLQDSINLMFFADLIDNDGNASNGFQAWDMEHGRFDFEVVQKVEGPIASLPGFNDTTVTSAITIDVGPMVDVLPLVA